MRLPSLKFLKTFQVAAKLQSFKAAAEELFVTPSAVSHQIKALEEQVFDKLFCARCGTWVSPDDFGWTRRESGAHAYHRACGDHGPELLKPSSWLGWQSDSWPSPRAAESREHPQEGLACLHLMRQLSNPGPEVRNLDQYRPDDEPSTRMTCLIIA